MTGRHLTIPRRRHFWRGFRPRGNTFQAETQKSIRQGAPNFTTKHTLRSKVRLSGEDSPQTHSVNQYEPSGLGPFAAATPPPPAVLIVVIVIILVAIVLVCQRRRRWCQSSSSPPQFRACAIPSRWQRRSGSRNDQCHRLGGFRRHADRGYTGSETKGG
jgi:hypothetical protein